jgi:hypothetical protein
MSCGKTRDMVIPSVILDRNNLFVISQDPFPPSFLHIGTLLDDEERQTERAKERGGGSRSDDVMAGVRGWSLSFIP